MYKKQFLPGNLKRAREANGYTLETLAKELKIEGDNGFSTVAKWELDEFNENGKKKGNTPTIETLIQLANLYNLDLNYFFTENATLQQFNKGNELFIPPAERALNKIKELNKAVDACEEKDKLLLNLKLNAALYEFLDMIKTWPDERIKQLQGMAFAFNALKQEPKKERNGTED